MCSARVDACQSTTSSIADVALQLALADAPLLTERSRSVCGNWAGSGGNARFRATTAMSPPQSQKKMRLSEARRLRLTEHIDASQVAFEVGCESPSQFSRDYSRQFGARPMRHIKRLMQQSTGEGPSGRSRPRDQQAAGRPADQGGDVLSAAGRAI